jgi:two-component system nitrogen regulation response regulator GlnG
MNTPAPKLLIVDDASHYVEVAHHFLRGYRYATRCALPGPCWTCARRVGCELTHAHDMGEVEEALGLHSDLDVVLLDVVFDLPAERLVPSQAPDLEKRRRLQGIAILAELRRTRPALPVILMTSQEELAYEDAAAALAVDEYVTFAGADAFDARSLGLLVERVLARRAPVADAGQYHWGTSPGMARLRRDAAVLARTSLPVLLLGESGTGKSALAEKVIHPASGRKGAFLAVDLAALPPSLVAAELFGTSRGAFSGATDRPGRFERADGGTLLLDELGNLPVDVQRTLLLAMESGRVTRLGENTARPVNVRVVAATNADLAAAVRAGTFRADLHARLNPAARLRVPALRDRIDDLPALVTALLLRTFASGPNAALLEEYLGAAGLEASDGPRLSIGRAPADGKGVTFSLSSATLRDLRAHAWPGNVRELDHLVTTAAVFAVADALSALEAGRSDAATAGILPISAKLVRELLVPADAVRPLEPERMAITVEPAPTLHALSRQLESQVFLQAYREAGGDFEALARRFLQGGAAANARRVRLRFNQLGLRVGRGVRSKK